MDHKAIREALEAGPTEGPWFEHHDKGHLYIENQRDDVVCDMGLRAKSSPTSQFIAACNPAAIRALLADLDAKTAEVERLQALRPVAMTPSEVTEAFDSELRSSYTDFEAGIRTAEIHHDITQKEHGK